MPLYNGPQHRASSAVTFDRVAAGQFASDGLRAAIHNTAMPSAVSTAAVGKIANTFRRATRLPMAGPTMKPRFTGRKENDITRPRVSLAAEVESTVNEIAKTADISPLISAR